MAATSRGIDVSNHQTAQDWKSIAAGGVTFAFIKASEGTHTHDARYRMHMDGILSVASLLLGAYHYAHPNQSATAEADNYIGVVQRDADAHPAFVHWLDLERAEDGSNYAGVSGTQIRAYAEAWVSRVKAAFPHQRVGVYTSGSDIAGKHYPANSDALWYPAYPAGAMSYTQAEQRTRPAPSGVKALFWQFTSNPVDRSICYMTPAQLRMWAGATQEVPDMTPEQAKQLADLHANLLTIGRIGTKETHAAGYYMAHAAYDAAAARTLVTSLTAQVGALTAAFAALKADGGITAKQVEAAAKAGADAALAELGGALQTADDRTPATS